MKIADFGIALSTQDFSKKLTSTGEFVGTPGYLSPEVCLGKPVDQRSDIFSLGIVLFEMLAGRMPFTDESPLGLMLEVVKAEIPDVCTLNHEVDPELSRILAHMIAKDPRDRYQSCHELIADLARHPLLAAGGTLKLQTQPSAAAATMIGMKTPVSGQSSLPNTAPTPYPPVVLPPATPKGVQPLFTPPANATPAAVHQPVLKTTAAPRSSALPLAIAALLVLVLGGGAWAYRDQIPFLKQLLAGTNAQLVAAPANNPAPAVQAPVAPATPETTTGTAAPSTAAAAADSATAQTAAPTATPAPAMPAAATPPASETASASAQPANHSADAAKSTPPSAVSAPASVPTAVLTTASTATTPASHDNAAGPAARASQVQPLKELAAAQAANAPAPAPRVARIEAPAAATAPPRPHVPAVAVLFGGDLAVSEPAGRVIERALTHHGYRLLDAEMMPRAERFIGGRRPNVAGLLEMLASGSRVDAVVIVHARAVGAQNISYYGQNDTMKTAQLNINVYAVHGQRKLGNGWSENVNFTALSAKNQAEEAVQEIAPQVESILVEYRPGRNRG